MGNLSYDRIILSSNEVPSNINLTFSEINNFSGNLPLLKKKKPQQPLPPGSLLWCQQCTHHCFCIISTNVSTVKDQMIHYYENSLDLMNPL